MIADNFYNSSPEVLKRIVLISGKKPECFKLDVTDEDAFDKLFEKYPDIDNVIHFAALKVCLHYEDALPIPIYLCDDLLIATPKQRR